MHGEGVMHGDIKGVGLSTSKLPFVSLNFIFKANILINKHGHACLADFGLTAIAPDPAFSSTSSSKAAGTTRWMSPERLDPTQFSVKDSGPTKESDCYALGMVVLEVLSGDVPFTRDCNELMVMQKVLEGEHPARPQGVGGAWFTDDLWEMLQVYWSPKPKDRPAVETVLECLMQILTVCQPLLPALMTTFVSILMVSCILQ